MIESAAYDIIKKEGWEEGKIEGRQEGRQEGKQEGKQEFLFKMLEGRFGTVPISLINKIKSEQSDRIYLFAQSLFEFQSMEEVERWWEKQE